MTLSLLKGGGINLYDPAWTSGGVPAINTSGLIDASGEKVAFIGSIWHPTQKTGSIAIRKVHFRTGTVSVNASSVLRVSLQDISLSAGPPYRPDESQDEYADILGSGLTSNAWITTGNLTADRTVNLASKKYGDTNSRMVAVVFEYQTFTAADSIVIGTVSRNMGTGASLPDAQIGGTAVTKTGGAWSSLATGNLLVLECADGTFAFMDLSYPMSAVGSVNVSSTGAIRAAGLKFRVPVEMTIEALGLNIAPAGTAAGTLTLYDSDGTTVLTEFTVDDNAIVSTTNRIGAFRCQPVTLAANTYYRLAFVATAAPNTVVGYIDVNAAGHMDAYILGQDGHFTTRDSGGTWTDTTTRRPVFMLTVSSIHDGAGGSGGVRYQQGTQGGLNG